MRTLTALAAAVLTSLSLTGCGAFGDAGGVSEGSPSDGVPSNLDVGDSEVEVLDSGHGPQQVLRSTFTGGESATSTMVFDQKISADGQLALQVPTISLGYDTEITDVDDEGADIVVTYAAPEVDGDSPEADTLRQVYDGLEGATVSGTLAPSGTLSDVETDIPDGADPTLSGVIEQFSSQLEQVAAPFPDEAIGEGAQWEVTATVSTEVQGLEISNDQTITYTLESLQGDRYEVSYTTEGTIDDAEGSTASVEGGETNGSGMTTGRLGAAAPASSRSTTTSSIDVTADGQSQTVKTEITIVLTSR